jgi:subtilisin
MRYAIAAGHFFGPDADHPELLPLLENAVHYQYLHLVAADLSPANKETIQGRGIVVTRLGRFYQADRAGFIGLTPRALWNLEAMRLHEAPFTGLGVIVGHLDTGVDICHPAVADRVVRWAAVHENGSRVDLLKDVNPGDSSPIDCRHGTRVAGVICGQEFDSQKGVAPGAMLSVVRMGETYGGPRSDEIMIAALDYLCGEGVRIVNISIDVAVEQPAHEVILKAAVAQNMLPVVPIGNRGADTTGVPGRCDSALGVGAVGEAGGIWQQSSSEEIGGMSINPDLLAPGDGVLTCAFDGSGNPVMAADSGTSFASPHIAGLAARLLEQDHLLSSAELRAKILYGCPLPPQADRAIRGVPDATKVLI